MSTNLPPGVSTNDIPSNRPEDIAWDRALELAADELSNLSDPEEIAMAVKIGIAAVNAIREDLGKMVHKAIDESREDFEIDTYGATLDEFTNSGKED